MHVIVGYFVFQTESSLQKTHSCSLMLLHRLTGICGSFLIRDISITSLFFVVVNQHVVVSPRFEGVSQFALKGVLRRLAVRFRSYSFRRTERRGWDSSCFYLVFLHLSVCVCWVVVGIIQVSSIMVD